jgi:YegS/Rv2252/BmrU family lipid kinase
MNTSQIKYIFIINPISFTSKRHIKDLINKIIHFFIPHSINPYIHISKFPRDSLSFIRNLYISFNDSDIIKIFAVGGDGILFDCLNSIIGLSNVELGALPYGNSNDFIRSFGEGLNNDFRDISNQFHGNSILTDIIYCGSNYALNTCTIGMESYAIHRSFELQSTFKEIANLYPNRANKLIYNLLYFIGGVLAINNKKIVNQFYNLYIDDQDYSGNYACINIANGPCYGGNMSSATAAIPNDGFLDVILFKSTGIFNFISKGFDYLYGKYYKYPDLISYYRAKEISIRSNIPLMIQLDGENFTDTNLTVKIIPKAIKFIAVNNHTYKEKSKFNG